jgi:hypothetical protein
MPLEPCLSGDYRTPGDRLADRVAYDSININIYIWPKQILSVLAQDERPAELHMAQPSV